MNISRVTIIGYLTTGLQPQDDASLPSSFSLPADASSILGGLATQAPAPPGLIGFRLLLLAELQILQAAQPPRIDAVSIFLEAIAHRVVMIIYWPRAEEIDPQRQFSRSFGYVAEHIRPTLSRSKKTGERYTTDTQYTIH